MNQKPDPLLGAPGRQEKPLKFPLPFKVFLRLVIGGRYYADRLAIYRKFCREDFLFGASLSGNPRDRTDSAIDAKVAEFIATLKSEGVQERMYWLVKSNMKNWRAHYARLQRVNAANSRWKKATFKKDIDRKSKSSK